MPTALKALMLCLLLASPMASSATPDAMNITGCPDICGGISIQYPFGIGAGCFRHGFEIICNQTTGTPVLAGTTKSSVPVNLLSITTAEARVMLPVAWACFNSSDQVYADNDGDVHFNGDEVYRISNTHNQLVVVGCNTLGYTRSQRNEGSDYLYAYYAGCMSYCNNSHSAVDGACASIGCCHVDIPPGLTDNRMTFEVYSHKTKLDYSPCNYAFLVDRNNYTFHTADLQMNLNRTMPVWLDWAIRDNLTCDEAKKEQSYACVSTNSNCHDSSNGPGYVCNCSNGYQGNPYIAGGCTDINECEYKELYPCRGVCWNTLGSYECKCRSGWDSADPLHIPCNPNFPLAAKIVTGAIGGLFIIAIVLFIILLGKEKRKMKEFFRKNGGPIIEKVNKIKLFKKEELEQMLKTSNCIGQGGFGEVYMGYIRDQTQPVAIKKPKIDVKLANQFANEVIIQSRVLHKNIVNLIGCCLEVDVPILVYEYVSNGSLDKILHDSNRVPLDLEIRLQIAAQSAKGLAYMHSEITTPILHGDVKPANILLNEDFVPKISDFGTSRMITIEEHYTSTIIGNWGYMDPEYVQTGLYTSKSDVYSFGVVLLELFTRKKVLDPDINVLLGNFYDRQTTKKGVIELIDPEISAEGTIGIFHSLAEIILECLNLHVELRPQMADVAERLQCLLK
ncbi:Wall-associated receptor kinase 1 [Dichanthelium oligosanthes]|uniref:Wall-associated receptor kinase 1 n=1 Tax=Dichanthelium oligosanthes TaxID=888268 RepID=A0A1E5VN90_9POAL|nr:Wall-associated receptor kinase 1 [Dichanthelium oligosanthes]